MWKFKNPIKHPILETRWPTAQEAEDSLVYQPIKIGPTEARSRTWVPAMVPWRATEDGFVTQENLDWYERFAAGRPGALVVEATGVRDIPSGPLLRIGHDRFIPGLRELADTVRRASGGSSRLFIQIIDFLAIKRRPDPGKYLRRFLLVTDSHREALGNRDLTDDEVRDRLVAMTDAELAIVLSSRELEGLRYGYRERVTDTHLPHVRDLPKVLPGVFADAARRAEHAG